ncbi:MAG: hypothetical protein ABFS35_18720 [Bacteroidota bacterium]
MQKSFDKILSEKIKNVFNNHKEPYNPDDWEKLKMQLKRKRRTPVIWLNIAKAASVALLFGVSTFYLNKDDVEKQITSIETTSPIINSQITVKTKEDSINKQQKENTKQTDRYLITQQKENAKLIDRYQVSKKIKKEEGDKHIKDTNGFIIEDELIKNSLAINKNDSNIRGKAVAIVDSISQNSLTQLVQVEILEDEFVIDKKERNSKFDFAVAVASMYSYSQSSTEGDVNLGGGFTASYNISDKLSVSSGMLIAQQSLDYNYSRTSDKVFASSPSFYDANTTLVSEPATATSRIEFVGIDIPLNVKLKLKKFIISTGVSSLLFVSEKRIYSSNAIVLNTEFNAQTNSYETFNSVENFQSEERSDAFGRMDFASLLNLSIGYEVPLKRGGIILEPFIKYPLSKVSSANMKIGSGGLSLHYCF